MLKDGRLHTGDLARADEEGFLYIVGRRSEMIKTGGHRVSPKEIEQVISGMRGVTRWRWSACRTRCSARRSARSSSATREGPFR